MGPNGATEGYLRPCSWLLTEAAYIRALAGVMWRHAKTRAAMQPQPQKMAKSTELGRYRHSQAS